MISIDELVGGAVWEMTQRFGKTYFSTHAGAAWYAYGVHYCLEWGTHPGVDIGIPVKTPLYSPVSGTVIVAGGTSVFTNVVGGSSPQTGQLKLQMDNGSHVILGHMRKIDVRVGDRIEEGQYVGLSGYNNGGHVHVEIRVPDAACSAGFRIVSPIGLILSEDAPPPSPLLRLFRVEVADVPDVDALSAYDQPRTDVESRGEYRHGEVVPCHTVVLAQEVKPNERAWGQISGGDLSGRWVYLGFTREVRPGENGVDLYVVTTTVKNVRVSPDSAIPPVGSYSRGSILPISDVVDGEEVDPGQTSWGRFAHGPFAGQFAYLGSNTTLKLT
jgi:hypothetical protein